MTLFSHDLKITTITIWSNEIIPICRPINRPNWLLYFRRWFDAIFLLLNDNYICVCVSVCSANNYYDFFICWLWFFLCSFEYLAHYVFTIQFCGVHSITPNVSWLSAYPLLFTGKNIQFYSFVQLHFIKTHCKSCVCARVSAKKETNIQNDN